MWFWLSLISAALGALSIIVNKRCLERMSSAMVTWSITALMLPILLVVILFRGVPQWSPWFLFAAVSSSCIFIFSKTLSLKAMRQRALSKLFPLSAIGTGLTYIWSVIFLKEIVHPLGVMGLCLILIGAYLLNAETRHEGYLQPIKLLFKEKFSFFFLLSVFLTSFVVIFDKQALISTIPEDAFFTLFVENFIIALILTPYLHLKQPVWISVLKREFPILLLGSALFTASVVLLFIAFATGPTALATAVRQLHLLFLLVLSYLFFKDKLTKESLLASAVMIVGTLLIKFS